LFSWKFISSPYVDYGSGYEILDDVSIDDPMEISFTQERQSSAVLSTGRSVYERDVAIS
jgi:hypothetical protein